MRVDEVDFDFDVERIIGHAVRPLQAVDVDQEIMTIDLKHCSETIFQNRVQVWYKSALAAASTLLMYHQRRGH